MAPTAKARRVSYVIPPPPQPAPRLVLPPLDAPRSGRSIPLIIPHRGESTPLAHSNSDGYFTTQANHPQHRLGVTSLALDTTTPLSGRAAPEGILYSGGRDGLIVAWEQSVPMRQRKTRYGREESNDHVSGRWEALTGWDDDDFDTEDDDEELDAHIANIPFEDRWQPDYENIQEHKVGLLQVLLLRIFTEFYFSQRSSVNAYNPTLTGSMTLLFATTIVPVRKVLRHVCFLLYMSSQSFLRPMTGP